METNKPMNVVDVIKKRRSCRTFKPDVLDLSVKKALESFIRDNTTVIGSDKINLLLVEKGLESKKMKLDYGMIQGHRTYLLGTSMATLLSRVNYGYLMEKVVLKATDLGICSCWVGYFDAEYFNDIPVDKDFEIPAIVVVGFSKEKQTMQDKFIRFTVNASKRLPWDRLFFRYPSLSPLTPENVKLYSESLEMVCLAPSSGNTQPWRIFFDESTREFHFYKNPVNTRYEITGLHDVDMGIALAHFELTSKYNGLSGSWILHSTETIHPVSAFQYIMTWKCD